MKSKYDAILFDLDGTLSQSADGIRNTIEYTLNSMNIPVPNLSDYSLYIGPPLRNTFLGLCGLTDSQADIAVEIYRKRYNEHGKYINKLFEGTAETLAILKESGARLAVASSKYEPFTREIIDILNISQYFDAVCGSDANEKRKEKEQLIPYAVQCLGANMNDRIVMVGDTIYDALGAERTGVEFIGVTYGYGHLEDIKRLGTYKLADHPYELIKYLTFNGR